MALTVEDRARVHRGLMRWWSGQREAVAVNKEAILAAVNATDDWIEANQASYNQALPQPFRDQATLVQKTLLFCAVALARVSIAFLRGIFGEVN